MKILTAIFKICLFVFMVGCTSNVSAIKVNQSTLIIAHRGASDRAPEETMSAFKLAVQDKADYLEMDLRQTKDGKLVLMHDPSLNRTTNGKGEVSEYSLMQIKKLDAGRWFSSEFKN
jgi:glycerophosphoryl diester phosphodiesterase